ncbi:MAG: DMT family transporter [Melioribacteraceae bacterium]|nr:DMT family transporter [Melioribacteraceae bacterium]
MKSKHWLTYAIVTTLTWGLWGALIEIPEKGGFPATLGYAVWALTMIIPAIIVLKKVNWKIEKDKKSIGLGLIIGFTGAGGQLILFQALITGPAYLVFPFISLSPVITILLSLLFLDEYASKRGWIGITLALLAIPLLSYSSGEGSIVSGSLWIILSLLVFLAWGFQGFVMKFANKTMKAESIFFYMTITGILLIPFAIFMTDFNQEINWGLSGPYLTAAIMLLNSVGALMLVYAFRYGKAIVVSPLVNAVAPIITVVISLILYQVIPHIVIVSGIALAIVAIFLLAIEEDELPEEEIINE